MRVCDNRVIDQRILYELVGFQVRDQSIALAGVRPPVDDDIQAVVGTLSNRSLDPDRIALPHVYEMDLKEFVILAGRKLCRR